MRSFFYTAVTGVYDRAMSNKTRKREDRKEQWRTNCRTIWNARLPPNCYQDNSFFKKLPLELRRLVYTYDLSGEQLYVEVMNEDKHFNAQTGREKEPPFRLRCLAAQDLLAFPASCKLAPLETAHYFYSFNTFQISGITALICFQRSLPTRYFQAIQSLHLQYSYPQAREMIQGFLEGIPPYDSSSWSLAWKQISTMRRLTNLRVDIVLWTRWIEAAYEDLLLSVVATVRDVENVEVYASWAAIVPADVEGAKVWPFTLRRGSIYRDEGNGKFSLGIESMDESQPN
ncbi:hypothetical protein EK21DRAFT_87967 [Setomelanomma holmii]|uniref:DUF7730 domain-containing protein n=1 Tax=Setomelanomma holmii TaxID=210430 RepID=A0A9P4HCC0_9PLEO|nr:hypothetical protein EK21DRAFT_87967 [Setomelanomma holmii]